jgi:hypothetical protein
MERGKSRPKNLRFTICVMARASVSSSAFDSNRSAMVSTSSWVYHWSTLASRQARRSLVSGFSDSRDRNHKSRLG